MLDSLNKGKWIKIKCGKFMILRTAKKGDNIGKQFWGCSGFPACRLVQQIKWVCKFNLY